MNEGGPAGRPRTLRLVGAAGALIAGAAVALAAYASHAATPDARERLLMAAAIAFGHGAVLAVAAGDTGSGRTGRLASLGLLVGASLFAGSLAGAALAGWSTRLAPIGGTLLIAGWLLLAVDRARR